MLSLMIWGRDEVEIFYACEAKDCCEAFTLRFLGACEVMLDKQRKKITCRGVKRLAGEISGLIKQLVAKKLQSHDSGLITPGRHCYNPHYYDPNYETSITAKSQPYG